MDVGPGSIIYSNAGRDKGTYFVVMSVSGEYVNICDGKGRKTDKPKKKKIKHIKCGIGFSEFISRKLLDGERVTNTELRRELFEYNQKEE